jgi:ASPIC and UnbV/FG-GAP-like repeat
MRRRFAPGLRRRFAPLAAVALLVLAGCAREADLKVFEDATSASGLGAYRGMTHGAAWGDVDGDGLPDLYVTNHLNDPQLWRNMGGGRFEDVTARWFEPGQIKGDKHGAVWADFDNDGRLDLVQLTGAVLGLGREPKRLYRHEGERLVDVAAAVGVDNPEGRTRMPLWLDLNGDGRLDLFQGAEARFDDLKPPFAFMQAEGRFDAADLALMIGSRSAPFCVLTELTGDDRPELVCRLMGQTGALQVFDLTNLPAKTLDWLPQTGFEDLAAADFDGDGRVDLFMARKNAPGPVAFGRPGPQALVAAVAIERKHAEQEMGFHFRAAGPLQVALQPGLGTSAPEPSQVRLGAAGMPAQAVSFTVDGSIGALAAARPGEQSGVQIGFTAPDRWEVRVTANSAALDARKPRVQELQFAITAAGDITGLEAVGPTADEAAPPRLFMNRGGKLVEEGEQRGIGKQAVAGMNAVAADFDNDGDVDLFVLASGDLGLQPNQLWLNDGQGRFTPVKAAGGALGGGPGVGDSVTVVDFDGDGRLDLLVATGGSMGRSLGLPSDGGNYRLYRNVLDNGYDWLQIDLQGSSSNRDGIGAIVRVTAGGKTQVRVQDGGVHHRGQNHARLHFGLGPQAQVERVQVRWPSGRVQELAGVKAGQVLRVVEP